MSSIIKPVLGSQLQHGHPLSKGLVFFPLFNEGSGTKVLDLSGNGNTGTFVSNPLWIAGTTGSAIDFSDDAINVGANVYNSVISECTIIAKVRWDGGGNTYGRIIDKYPGPSLLIETDRPSFRFYGKIGGASIDDRWVDTSSITAGTYCIVAARLGSGFQELYVNGVLVEAELAGGPYAGAYDIGSGVNAYIGNRASDMARDWDGPIEYLYIYNRALSSREIAQLYQEPFCMFEREPIELWAAAAASGVPPVGAAGIMTLNTGYWGPTF